MDRLDRFSQFGANSLAVGSTFSFDRGSPELMCEDNCQILNVILSNPITDDAAVFVDRSRNKSQTLITHTDGKKETNELFLPAAVNAGRGVNIRANCCECGRVIVIFTSQHLQSHLKNINEFRPHMGGRLLPPTSV